ncbi:MULTISPECIES: CPBP family intramembrane glutamic endopeptidase [Thermus]|jgi:membrane protease YdiL (CAAX protease family)|uniref:CAAX amino terminal protease self-immunity n=1 Tax=Thermus brockianus TaxID=56956 RepID=A0A1J0LSL2_THEBO|nr:type II CAAX endopeptidase family protein [Thermus brockianus]APD09310.1 CAAX amino terminal protease self- immunity [Thermus brockianus]
MKALYWNLGLSWGLFLAYHLLGGRWGSSSWESALFGVLYMWVPGLLALRFAQKEGLKLPLTFRPNRFWLFAWLYPLALALLSIPLSLPFAPWRELAEALPPGLSLGWVLASALLAGATVNLLAALGEELFWRGYLWERLRERGFWPATLEIGFYWGLWHAPLVLAGHNYPHEPLLGVPAMILFALLLTPALLGVREKGGIWAAALLHGTLNAVAGLPFLLLERTHDLLVGVVGLPGFFLMALFNLWLRRRV